MNKRTRNLTLSAIFSALTVVTLYFASVWPTGLFGLVAVASLFSAAAVIEAGLLPGVYVYLISSILGMILVPNRAAPLVYIFFFGYYPVIKSLFEHINSKILQWILKLIVFCASLTIMWFLFRELVFSSNISFNLSNNSRDLILLYLGGSVVFCLFDYGYTKLIWFYINRISKFTKT